MNFDPLNPTSFLNSTEDTSLASVSHRIHLSQHQSPFSDTGSDPSDVNHPGVQGHSVSSQRLLQFILTELQTELNTSSASVKAVASRIAAEVKRICEKSDRIQKTGQVQDWQIALAKHRVQKCLAYYRLGSKRGRVELHSNLSAMVYRQVAPARANLGFQARYSLIEDFLQGFYIEVMNAFRRENNLPDYTPRTRLELAEYMAFTDQYAKRRITLPGRRNQQLVVLRAQGFANKQPVETAMDIEMAMESAKGDDADIHNRSPLAQQVRDQMVSDAVDPSESVLRDRVISELINYLDSQGQSDCVDYLILKLKDLSVREIDEILGLNSRERDYLQQRFKYHVEKFARSHRWQLVHQWLGADIDQNLGMPQQQWEAFLQQLSPDELKLLELKGLQASDQAASSQSDQEIAKLLKCTPKQVHKRWVKLLEKAWQFRNQ